MIHVQVTEPAEPHCFRLTIETPAGEIIEINLHAWALAELIAEASIAHAEWTRAVTESLLCRLTGLTPEEARAVGLLAPLRAPPPAVAA